MVTSIKLDPTCLPKNWSYSWFRVGNTWFTEVTKKVTWSQAVVECTKIEAGRTSLASIETKEEQDAVFKSDIVDTWHWIAGAKFLPLQKWFWYKHNGEVSLLKPISASFWDANEPSGDPEGYCMNIK